VIAVARSRVASLPREEARTLMLSTPAIAERVTTRLAERLRTVSAQRTMLGVPNPAQRVCAQLIQLSVNVADGRMVIAHAPTHQEIAIMINTSRETVTRVFQVLQARGILRREGNQLRVEDTRYLNDVAEGRTEPPKSS
jgi:CRP-like cAMP-binding protein